MAQSNAVKISASPKPLYSVWVLWLYGVYAVLCIITAIACTRWMIRTIEQLNFAQLAVKPEYVVPFAVHMAYLLVQLLCIISYIRGWVPKLVLAINIIGVVFYTYKIVMMLPGIMRSGINHYFHNATGMAYINVLYLFFGVLFTATMSVYLMRQQRQLGSGKYRE